MIRLASRIAFAAVGLGLSFGAFAQEILVLDNNDQKINNGAGVATHLPLTTFKNEIIGNSDGLQFFVMNESFTNTLNVSSITITGPQADEFTVVDSTDVDEILPQPNGFPGYFIVQFNPAALGVRTAQVNIFSNDPDSGGVFSFAIAGTGVAEPATELADLGAVVEKPKKVKVSEEGKVTVRGKVFIENTGPVPSDQSLLEIYISNKSYLDETARLVKVRPIKKMRADLADKTHRRKVKYKADGQGYEEGYVFAVITPVAPLTDRNWFTNVGNYRYPDWN